MGAARRHGYAAYAGICITSFAGRTKRSAYGDIRRFSVRAVEALHIPFITAWYVLFVCSRCDMEASHQETV